MNTNKQPKTANRRADQSPANQKRRLEINPLTAAKSQARRQGNRMYVAEAASARIRPMLMAGTGQPWRLRSNKSTNRGTTAIKPGGLPPMRASQNRVASKTTHSDMTKTSAPSQFKQLNCAKNTPA